MGLSGVCDDFLVQYIGRLAVALLQYDRFAIILQMTRSDEKKWAKVLLDISARVVRYCERSGGRPCRRCGGTL